MYDYSKKITQNIFSDLKSKSYIIALSDRGLNTCKTIEKPYVEKNLMLYEDGTVMCFNDGTPMAYN